MSRISVDAVCAAVDYDPHTGLFRWKDRPRDHFPTERSWKTWRATYVGKPAFVTESGDGYKIGCVFGVRLKAHRAAFAVMLGRWPKADVDHINGDRSDNRWENLRDANRSQNSRNRPSRAGSTSKFLGVSRNPHDGLWYSRIKSYGKQKHLGCYHDEVAAAARYNEVAAKIHGPFARLNNLEGPE